MKKIVKKLGISIIIVCAMSIYMNMLFDFEFVQAESTNAISENEIDMLNGGTNNQWFGDILDGLLGIVTWIPRVLLYASFNLLKAVVWGITAIGGAGVLNIEDIIFTDATTRTQLGAEIVSIDFFSSHGGTIGTLRENVAIWYYSLRNLSIIILLGILLYVGIRMAISTVASEEAKYKKMFKDWVVSLLLIFVMHYIMIFTIEINKVLVTVLYDAMKADVQNNGGAFALNQNPWDEYMGQIANDVFHWSFTVGTASLIIYGIMIGITIIYLFMYIKRMLTIGFLIIISPLVTITYSIDKMGDGKSQALNAWLKEFVYNVLIQPFHCIIYIVFVSTAIGLMQQSRSMASAVLAVIMILFMHKAEDIVKQIFNFQSGSLAKAMASTAAITTGLSFIKGQGDKNSKKGPGKVPNIAAQSKGASGTGRNGTGASGTGRNGTGASGTGASGTGKNGSGASGTEGNATGASDTEGNATGASGTEENATAQKRDVKKPRPTAKQTFKTAAGYAGKTFAYLALATLGASTGNFQGIVSGLYAANSLNKGVTASLNKRSAKKVVENNEKNFAGVYQNYQKSHNMSKDDMADFTQNLVDGNYDYDKLNEDQKEYLSYVNKMKQTYKVTGEDDVSSRMFDTINMINNGDIEAEYSDVQKPEEKKSKKKSKKEKKSKK